MFKLIPDFAILHDTNYHFNLNYLKRQKIQTFKKHVTQTSQCLGI